MGSTSKIKQETSSEL